MAQSRLNWFKIAMKFYLVFLIFMFLQTKSQENPARVFILKPSLGLNGCQIHGDSYSGYNKLGLFAGVAVNAQLSTKASFELGFYFSQKGARHNQNPKAGDYTFYRVNLNYIDLPISFRYHVNSVYFITLGPSVAYLFSYYEDINNSNVTGQSKFNNYEVGVNFGLGRKIKNKIYVEVRTSNSVTAVRGYGRVANLVFYPNPVARFFNRGLYNNILTVLLTYKIDLKNKRAE